MSADSFISMCLQGRVLAAEVDEFVKTWHSSQSDVSLREFVGMTEREYNAWMLDSSVLPFILKARRYGQPLERVLENDVERVAARNSSGPEVMQVLRWLRQHAG